MRFKFLFKGKEYKYREVLSDLNKAEAVDVTLPMIRFQDEIQKYSRKDKNYHENLTDVVKFDRLVSEGKIYLLRDPHVIKVWKTLDSASKLTIQKDVATLYSILMGYV